MKAIVREQDDPTKKFISDVANFLNIPAPKISYDTSVFATATTLATANPNNNIIYIRKSKFSPDFAFAIAHELRHIWQYYNRREWLDEHISQNETDKESYNLQIAEIDAHAFGCIVMTNWFHIKPLFNGMSKKAKNIIFKRAEEIAEQEYS